MCISRITYLPVVRYLREITIQTIGNRLCMSVVDCYQI
jgi:hypothetical protein